MQTSLGQISALVTGDEKRQRNLKGTLGAASIWLRLSVVTMLLYALALPWAGPASSTGSSTSAGELAWHGFRLFLVTFSTAAMVGAGSFAVGALLGFLFGIPKTASGAATALPLAFPPGTLPPGMLLPGMVPPPGTVPGVSMPGMPAPGAVTTPLTPTTGNPGVLQLEVNTNLEQVSDWLTKILVGVGLTQFDPLATRVWELAGKYAQVGGPAVALAIMLNFVIAGFLCGYLITRLFLASAFVEAVGGQPSIAIQEQTDRARDLEKEKDWGSALNAYESALAQVTPTTSKPQKRQVYEGAMYNALYQDPPDGFEKAIKYGTEFLRDEPDFASGRLWAYLAAAYGQQFRYLTNNPGAQAPDQALADARAKALESVRNALRVDPNVKELLRLMWDPGSPIKSPQDNDLEVFFADEEFRALLKAG
jgi:hypothetical protein